MVEILTIGGIVSLFTNLALGLFVYSKNRQRPINKYFALFSISIALWSAGSFLANAGFGPRFALKVLRWCYIAAVFLPTFYIHFISHIVQKFDQHRKIIISSYAVSIILSLALMSNVFIVNVREMKDGFLISQPGPAYYVFFVFMTSCTLYGLYSVLKKINESQGYLKTKLMWMFGAQIIAQVAGFEYFSAVFRLWDHIPSDDYILVGHFTIMSYAILRHKLLDIEVVIKKTLIFTGLFSCVFGLFGFTLFFVTDLFQQKWGGMVRWWLLAGASAAYVLIGRRLEFVLINITDRFLFQRKFDYRKVLKDASRGLSRVNSLKYQLTLVTHFLTSRARIRSAAIYMPENGRHDFVLKVYRCFEGSMSSPERIAFDSQILMYFKKERRKPYLEFYEVEDQTRKYGKNTSIYRYDFVELRKDLQALHAYLVIPSFYQDELQGILVLGEKRSEEPYNDEDINLFQTIAQESAIAFENARKHDELVEQREELARINEELRKTQEEVIQAKETAAVAAISAGISHEVNNSILGLTGAIGEIKAIFDNLRQSMIDWFRSGDPVPEAQKHEIFMSLRSVKQALSDAQNTSHHIEDVVQTLSQIAKGKHAKMTRISLRIFLKNAVNASMLRTYRDRLKTQNLEEPPELDMEKNLPAVKAHTELLNSVFINLFKNAFHAMNDVVPKKIRIHALTDPAEKNMVRIEFSDNGCGIRPEILRKIFDYGFTTKGEQGEGKGLYNAKSIIEGQHGGKMEVESEVGKGTTFIIKIPIWKDEED